MPAKKRKPVTPAIESPPTTGTEPPATATPEPDVFDRAIAARADSPSEVQPVTAAAGPEGGDRAAAPTMAFQPDPFPALSVALGDAADSPRVRLFRNRRMNQVAIRFDEKPPEPVRRRLRDEGYKWRDAEGVWTKQLGEHRATGQLAAERLVEDIANGVRAEGGLAPVGRAVGE